MGWAVVGARCPGHVAEEGLAWEGCARPFRPPTVLYLAYNATETVYVGIADDWKRRLRQHRAVKAWWPTINSVVLIAHCCRFHALEAEAFAICNDRPTMNICRPAHRHQHDLNTAFSYRMLEDPQRQVA